MAKRAEVPDVIPVDPLTLYCPYCGADKGKDCSTSRGGFAVLHVLRIKAAAALDVKARKTRKKAPR